MELEERWIMELGQRVVQRSFGSHVYYPDTA